MNSNEPLNQAAEYHGVKIPFSAGLDTGAIARIHAGRYAKHFILGALHVTKAQDRVLELGSTLGIVSAVTQHNAQPVAVSLATTPAMAPQAEALFTLNRMKSKIKLNSSGAAPFERFAAQQKSFKPTILLMTMAGDELEILRQANLDDLKAVVIEFHPEVYGQPGIRECKNLLRKAGFARVDAVSGRKVSTFLRRPDKPDQPPSPERGWSRSCPVHDNALVVPPLTGVLKHPMGILTQDGSYVHEGATWRRGREITLQPALPEGEIEHLNGTWLWGGQLWQHFGHFLVESTTRLWALEQWLGKIDGILFTPKRPKSGRKIARWQQDFLAQLAPDTPVEVAIEPTKVERLVVPGQGFGLGMISSGTPEFRSYVANNFGKDIAPDGPERLYVSRSKLNPSLGALIGEPQLEALLEQQGYETFHPQGYDIATQIARYKAAKQIIAPEGSAIHMLAMLAKPEQEVAIILRRESHVTAFIQEHLKSFSGREAVTIDSLTRNWMPPEQKRTRLSWGEMDLSKLQAALSHAGFVSDSKAGWQSDNAAEVEELVRKGFTEIL